MRACVHRMVYRWRAMLADVNGQASVEFALVFVAFLSIVMGLAALMNFVEAGALVSHALQTASHHMATDDAGVWGDVLAY